MKVLQKEIVAEIVAAILFTLSWEYTPLTILGLASELTCKGLGSCFRNKQGHCTA